MRRALSRRRWQSEVLSRKDGNMTDEVGGERWEEGGKGMWDGVGRGEGAGRWEVG